MKTHKKYFYFCFCMDFMIPPFLKSLTFFLLHLHSIFIPISTTSTASPEVPLFPASLPCSESLPSLLSKTPNCQHLNLTRNHVKSRRRWPVWVWWGWLGTLHSRWPQWPLLCPLPWASRVIFTQGWKNTLAKANFPYTPLKDERLQHPPVPPPGAAQPWREAQQGTPALPL